MEEFYFISSNFDQEYDYEIQYWPYDEGVVLAIAFIPTDECNETITNSFIALSANSIELSFEYNAKMFILTEEDNFQTISKLFEYEQLHFMYFLAFPNHDKMLEYIARMEKEGIF